VFPQCLVKAGDLEPGARRQPRISGLSGILHIDLGQEEAVHIGLAIHGGRAGLGEGVHVAVIDEIDRVKIARSSPYILSADIVVGDE